MISKIQEYLEEVTEALEEALEPRDKLEILIEFGRELEEFPEELKNDDNRVPNCLSEVFINADIKVGRKLAYTGFAASFVVGGYLSILINALDGLTPEDIVKETEKVITHFAESSKVNVSMMATRANAFESIYRFMQKKAVHFCEKE